MYKLEASKLSLPSVSTGFAHLSVLLLKALLMRLLKGRLTRRVGRREHVLYNYTHTRPGRNDLLSFMISAVGIRYKGSMRFAYTA